MKKCTIRLFYLNISSHTDSLHIGYIIYILISIDDVHYTRSPALARTVKIFFFSSEIHVSPCDILYLPSISSYTS